MAISIFGGRADLAVINMAFIGDDVSTTAEFDLSVAPFNLNFNGNAPVALTSVAFSINTTPTITMTAVLALRHSAVHLVLTFSSPIPSNNQSGQAQLSLVYTGVA